MNKIIFLASFVIGIYILVGCKNDTTKSYESIISDTIIQTEANLVTDKNLEKKDEVTIEQTTETIQEDIVKNIPTNQQDYFYEPDISTISGTIKVESFFGPPNYGESPETDSREDSYIFTVENSINVNSKSEEPEEGDYNITKSDIFKIQLTSTNGVKLTKYKNKAVRLTGTFFGASTGHHHTEVLMDVQKIEEL